MSKVIAKRIGSKCLHCGVVIQDDEVHPDTVEFVNGYPIPCRMSGKPIIDYLFPWDDEIHWMAQFEYLVDEDAP